MSFQEDLAESQQREREESAQKGWNNMLYIEKHGIKVIPVFHQHETMDWLDKICQHTDYFGVSPANDVTKKQRIEWLDTVYSIIKGKYKTHGFGATAKDIIYRYPWYSVDSTSWKAVCRYGQSCTINFKRIGLKGRKPPKYTKAETVNEIKRWLQLEKDATDLWAKRGVKWK